MLTFVIVTGGAPGHFVRHYSIPEPLAYIKRLVRIATETPLAQGLLLERRLFMKLCLSDAALSRMRAYDEQDSASPSRVT